MIRRRILGAVSDTGTHARQVIAEAHPALVALSHSIHANPEVAFEENRACGQVADLLVAAGFDVRRHLGGLPTAVAGSLGTGPFHVALVAEYDALPGVGHACGHNVIAAAAVGAGLALAAVAEQLGLRVTVIGTPAEEGGGGKIQLLEAGAFDGVQAALMVHPAPLDTLEPSVLAVQSLDVTYTGREAHAAGAPELGVNAADAFVVAQVAIGLLRQHLPMSTRVHGIVSHGGDAPNIVPGRAEGRWMVRAPDVAGLEAVRARILRCFEAGAMATGALLSVEPRVRYSNMVQDADLLERYRVNAEALGRRLMPGSDSGLGPISTDMGDVSHAIPSIHPMIGIDSLPAVNHQPGFTAAAASPAADRAIHDGALAMALTVIDVALDEEARERLVGRARAMEDARRIRATGDPAGAAGGSGGAKDQDVLVDDVGHEAAGITVGS